MTSENQDFKWTCLRCECEQTETVDPIDGPFVTCTCERCGFVWLQDEVRND